MVGGLEAAASGTGGIDLLVASNRVYRMCLLGLVVNVLGWNVLRLCDLATERLVQYWSVTSSVAQPLALLLFPLVLGVAVPLRLFARSGPLRLAQLACALGVLQETTGSVLTGHRGIGAELEIELLVER